MPRKIALTLVCTDKDHDLAMHLVASSHSYGFRPERSTADAADQCFKVLARRCSPSWVLEADIKNCFDQISHDWLIKNVPMDKAMLQKWLKAGYVFQSELFPTDAQCTELKESILQHHKNQSNNA